MCIIISALVFLITNEEIMNIRKILSTIWGGHENQAEKLKMKLAEKLEFKHRPTDSVLIEFARYSTKPEVKIIYTQLINLTKPDEPSHHLGPKPFCGG